jgi:hypothetical protein
VIRKVCFIPKLALVLLWGHLKSFVYEIPLETEEEELLLQVEF